MYAKSLFVVILVAALTVALSQAAARLGANVDCSHQGQQHNYTFGARTYRDSILWENELHLKSKLWQITTKDLTYPESGSFGRPITYIELTDLRRDATGGCAWLTAGGVGYSFIKIHYETLRNHGLDFHIKIYG